MTDEKIIELLIARDERALAEIEKKYSKLCKFTAGNFLNSREDVEECLNDVLLTVWNHIPPEVPECLPAYLTVLARNAARTRSRASFTAVSGKPTISNIGRPLEI
jgi:RNA polymerase sigma-70 factor (ECF subfamily)